MAQAEDLDLLLVASNFAGFSGPNSPLLDLGNFLHGKMGVRCAVVTHDGPVEEAFGRSLAFPAYRWLSGSPSSGWTRASHAPMNTARLRRAVREMRPRHLLAASGIDLAFELSWALRRPVPFGHNVLFNWAHRAWAHEFGLPVLPPSRSQGAVYATLDRVASRSIVQGILAHTEFHRRLYRAEGIPDASIRLVPHAVDAGALRASAMAPDAAPASLDTPTVLYVGRLEPDKGVRELVQASAIAAKTLPLRLRIVGSGRERTWVEAFIQTRARKFGLEVELFPPMPRSQVAGMIRACDLVAQPSRVEMFGMVALEAMAFAKPVLSTRYGGVAEVVRDQVDGLLVDPMDTPAMARALVRLGSDARLRRALGDSGRARVETAFDVPVVAPRFLRAIESFS